MLINVPQNNKFSSYFQKFYWKELWDFAVITQTEYLRTLVVVGDI